MNNRFLLKSQSQHGFTLVELIISMVLGLILIGGVYSVFTENARTSQLVQATSRVQENGRFALSYLMSEMRMVGYMGCLSGLDVEGPDFVNTLRPLVDPAADYFYDLKKGQLEVIEKIGTSHNVIPWHANDPVPTENTDIVVIRGLSTGDVTIDGAPPSKNAANFKVKGADTGIYEGDIVFLSDCQRGAVFQVTNANPNPGADRTVIVHNERVGGPASTGPGNEDKELYNDEPFSDGATIQKFTVTTYFVAPAKDIENNVLSLWRKDGSAEAFELVYGIEDLEIWLGEDTSGDGVPDRIVRPVNLVDAGMGDVVTVDIRVTANSIDPVEGSDPLKRDFFASVKLRNRGI
jgi:type IV pilus assembly protein PilW